ncbi:MAG: VWA domain-containing protein [Acidobacteriota bacterium]|nr:VWA domain-containing protein [Acidobacteriota bacterium]
MVRRPILTAFAFVAAVPLALNGGASREQTTQDQQNRQPHDATDDPRFVFRTGIDLINVAATVTDRRGRFVSGLTQENFRVFEDGEPVEITFFDNERVPVSLGIALDTSGSMEGRKMDAARHALDRFLYDLLGPEDDIFLYRFSYTPVLLQGWTIDRDRLSRALRDIRPRGGTALYDAVAESVPLVAEGRHRKKALLVISDGNDTNSETDDRVLRALIRENEALIYAIGIDGRTSPRRVWNRGRPPFSAPGPTPFPFPGGGRRPPPLPRGRPQQFGQEERVNVGALRDLTDDSGGRTEIIRSIDDLDPATEGIARELSQQYFLGYPAQHANDGEWHSIRVEVSNPDYRVRARRGYTATTP